MHDLVGPFEIGLILLMKFGSILPPANCDDSRVSMNRQLQYSASVNATHACTPPAPVAKTDKR